MTTKQRRNLRTPQATAQQQPAATPSTGPTGPRTEDGKARTRLNAFRHGLTGQTFVVSPEDAETYRTHHAEIRKHYQPAGPVESALTDQIAAGIWRLQRAHAIEEGLFALDSASNPDSILGPARTWLDQGKALNLLALYEGRIRRAFDRDKAELAALQSARKQQAAEAMNQAVALHRLAKSESKPYDPAQYFQTSPLTPESVFSIDLVAAESARREALQQAQSRLAQLQRQPKAA